MKTGAKVTERNPYRFGPGWGLYYYGFRCYDPQLGPVGG